MHTRDPRRKNDIGSRDIKYTTHERTSYFGFRKVDQLAVLGVRQGVKTCMLRTKGDLDLKWSTLQLNVIHKA